ncbi:hypothetical protein IQ260_24820 [Leptolyngbya cf. ectocarpi LEGE 11479]|uniref:PEP-CTERM sorting domain-containing protein n=1 Tax=Leptolyngbya cf. ectocarpi LEGE 11479 TaxID=1828722 RepID=A0A928ZYK1_LEPEC|nr:hypothetical protein [Leptolyngbya ectocarpi]MBE9069869.1 hypothetical protein [Leptolyngbya cf. ectocarpi LEGE 11479]
MLLVVTFSQAIRCKLVLPVTLLTALGILAAPVKAASFVLENIRFSEVAGDFTITGGEITKDALRIFQDVTGPNVDLFTSIEGLRSTGFFGFRFESVVTNRTNTPWIFYDHELQEQFGVASPEEDGLSFAQQFGSLRPVSNAFSVVDEVTDVRDFVNFSGGVVNPNQTVTFRYFILDNAPNDLFFLRQRPNFAPGGVGVVAVQPVVPPPAPPPIQVPAPITPEPPPAPIIEPPAEPPVTQPIPQPAAQVPEPGMFLGLLSLLGLRLLWPDK